MKEKIVSVFKKYVSVVFVFAIENLLVIAGLIALANERITAAVILALFSIPIAIRESSKRIEEKLDLEKVTLKADFDVTVNDKHEDVTVEVIK